MKIGESGDDIVIRISMGYIDKIDSKLASDDYYPDNVL